MTYRRYGYKAPQGNEGGAYDSYTIFRFSVVVLSFLMLMLSYVYSSNMLFFGHYFLSGMLFLLVGFAQEFFPKLKNIPVFVTALFLILFAEANREIWFSIGKYVVNAQGFSTKEYFFNIETYYIYIIYNVLLCITSLFETIKGKICA